jgi:hypothetical protein
LADVVPYLIEYARFGSILISGIIRITRVQVTADAQSIVLTLELNGQQMRYEWPWSVAGVPMMSGEWVSIPGQEQWQMRSSGLSGISTETNDGAAVIRFAEPVQFRYRAPWWARPFQRLMTVTLHGFEVFEDAAFPQLSGLAAGWVSPRITWQRETSVSEDPIINFLAGYYEDKSRQRVRVEESLQVYYEECERSGVQPTEDGARTHLVRTGAISAIGYLILCTFLSEWIRDWFIRRRGG